MVDPSLRQASAREPEAKFRLRVCNFPAPTGDQVLSNLHHVACGRQQALGVFALLRSAEILQLPRESFVSSGDSLRAVRREDVEHSGNKRLIFLGYGIPKQLISQGDGPG